MSSFDFGFMELCGHEFPNNYDPQADWTGSIYCTLFPHDDRTSSHIGFTPSGTPRKWHDMHGRYC